MSPLVVSDDAGGPGPNPGAYHAQAEPSSLDWLALSNAMAATVGVVNGCSVTAGTVSYSTTTSAAYSNTGANTDVSMGVNPVATALPQGTPLIIAGATATPVVLTAAAAASATTLDVQQPDGAEPASFSSGATVATPALYVMVAPGAALGGVGESYMGVWYGEVGGSSVGALSCGVPLATADPTNPRIDCIVMRIAGGLSSRPYPLAVTGTPAADPSPPAIGATDILLAEVYIPAGASSLSASNITDKRGFVSLPVLGYFANTAQSGTVTTTSTTLTHVMNYYGVVHTQVTFVAPASGSVQITCCAEGVQVSAGTMYWQIADVTAGYPGTALGAEVAVTTDTVASAKSVDFYVHGLTAAKRYTLEWQWAMSSSSDTGTIVVDANGSPVMTVIPLPLQL